MKILYINTCSADVIIKLFKKNKIIKEECISGQKNNSQFIMPAIKKVLDKKMPDSIIVVNGPGSFTGVRLGVTIAKTFAYLLNIPIRSITTLEEMAVSLNSNEKVVAYKENNGYYVGIFDKENILIGQYIYLNNLDFEQFSQKYEVKTNVTINYAKVVSYILEKETLNPHSVNPLYVKLIEVEK